MRTLALLLMLFAAGRADSGERLELTYLANEGFLISTGSVQVLIDAFVARPYSIYPAVPQPTARAMLESRPPFTGIELALASHVHRDHFQPAFARLFLTAHRETHFVSSPQVLDTLGDLANTSARYPAPGETAVWSDDGIRVEFLNLSHGTGRFADIQNLGHLIHIGDFSVLHVGDAAMDERNFAAYDLDARDLDVALIPYWYFSSTDGRSIIDRHLKARLRIAVHLPHEGDDDNVRAARAAGNVAIAERPLQQWSLDRP